MNWRKVFRRGLTVIFILASLLTAVVVAAAIQIFDGTGQYIMSDFENHDIAKQRAQQRAELDAQKKAGVYLTSFSRSVNATLTNDEISAVTNKIIKVSDVKIVPVPFETNGEAGLMYRATIKASIDTDGLIAYIKRDEIDKVTIVQQNNGLRDAIAKNDALIEDLKEKYKRATSQKEKDIIIQKMKQADREFLAIQKLEETFKLWDNPNNYNKAIELCNESIKLNQNYAKAYTTRGDFYSYKNQDDLALSDYNKAIELESSAENYIYRARFYGATKGKYDLALADYNKAIELEPSAKSYIYRARFYKENGNYELALADYNNAVESEPTAKNYINRAKFYKDVLKNDELALTDYNKAIEVEPIISLGYRERAYFYEWKGNYELANADYNKAIELEADNISNHSLRFSFYANHLKNYELAIEELNKIIELEPTVYYYERRADFYKRFLKNYDLALADYNKIIELEPTPSNYTWRAKFYASHLKNYDLALADYSKAIEIEPTNNSDMTITSRYRNRALFYKDVLKNYELAIEDYNKAIKFVTHESMDKFILDIMYGERGEAYYELKNYKLAFKNFNKAIKIRPNSWFNYDRRGKYYQKLGEIEKAQADFAKARELNGKS